MKVISPFGPKIAKLKFSNKLIKKINHEVDQILNKKSLLKKLSWAGKTRIPTTKVFCEKKFRKSNI